MAARSWTVITLLLGLVTACRAQFELDERFLEYRKHGMWLVEFYAPWCGHCKKLDPIYREVANELHQANSPVKVAKLDCTRYSHVASEFSVRGFPTIMFIEGDRTFTHRGDRTKEDILEFTLRAQGPTVRKLSSIGKFNEALGQHSGSVFFVYIGDDDEYSDFFKKYANAADAHVIHSYFYSGKKHIIGDRTVKHHPTVLVFKDNKYYEFEPPDGVVTASSVQHWINRERYATFPKMSGPGLNEMVGVAKYLVILAAEGGEFENPSRPSARLFKVMEELAFKHREKFHSQFQFLWMDELETANSIAMSFLSSPVFMVMETEEHLYYTSPEAINFTVSSMAKFLIQVADGKVEAYGGTGILMRLRRMGFDFVSLILSIWQASRWLFLLIFGLPTVIISIICYSLCCMETIDDIPEDEEDEDDEDEDRSDTAGLYDASPPPITSGEGDLPSYDALAVKAAKSKEDKKNE